MSTLARALASGAAAAAILASSLFTPAPPVFTVPDWSASSPCPIGRSLLDTERPGLPVSSGVEGDGLTCVAG